MPNGCTGRAARPAREFLSERGFELADAERFGVGYSPPEWEALTRHLRGRGFTDAELMAGGLASQGRRGPVDRFRGRLMWPIRDLTGDVIAFGARKLAVDDDGAKYLNTPETPLFKKSSVLYGADLAKREIAQRRQAVVVEGYTDVMACHLAGVPTAVATSGTSFGEGHIKVLRRLLMDADWFRGRGHLHLRRRQRRAAGGRCVRSTCEERFVTQTFVRGAARRPRPLRSAAQARRRRRARPGRQRVPVYEFAIRNALAQTTTSSTNEGRLAALDAAARIIARIKDDGLRNGYAVNLDRWLGLNGRGLRARPGRPVQYARRRSRGRARNSIAGPARLTGSSPASGRGPHRPWPGPHVPDEPRLRPGRPGDPGGAGSAQAGHPAAGAVRARVRRHRPGRLHRAKACNGQGAGGRLRRHRGGGQRPAVGGIAAGAGPGGQDPRLRDPAGGGAAAGAAGRRGTRRAVCRRRAGAARGTRPSAGASRPSSRGCSGSIRWTARPHITGLSAIWWRWNSAGKHCWRRPQARSDHGVSVPHRGMCHRRYRRQGDKINPRVTCAPRGTLSS